MYWSMWSLDKANLYLLMLVILIAGSATLAKTDEIGYFYTISSTLIYMMRIILLCVRRIRGPSGSN